VFKPDGKPTRRWILTVVVIFALIGALWFNQHQGLRAVTNDLSAQSLENCQEIEALKGRVRDRVNEDYRNLDRNGKLLGITITPELRAQAKADRDATLKRYSPQSCPR